ncbi:hypothetical protein [Rubritalea squalenifaciens]|nr:hypothetical protein [Rubritalea squalenifaciens]
MSRLVRMTLLAMISMASTAFAGHVYENLSYGDTRETVTKKLLACPRLEVTVPETMFGRVGLNGSFKIKKDLNGLKFSLFFDWDETGGLKEVTLRSEDVGPSDYNSKLKEYYSDASDLITRIYGSPIMSNDMPPRKDINPGAIMNSHLWHPGEGSLMLGVAHAKDKYYVSIRFTSKVIKPVKTEN